MKTLRNAFKWIFKKWANSNPEPKILFFEVLKQYLDKYNAENELQQCTVEKNDKIMENIAFFLKTNNLMDLEVGEVRIKHMELLKLWLHRNLESCCLTHSARHLSMCSRALKYAVRQEYINYNVLESMELKRDRIKEVIYLEWNEYIKLAGAHFANEIYNQVRDLYVFQCSTGISYGDLSIYKVLQDKKGKEWISDGRDKNDKAYRVPLFEPAKEIHNRYAGKLPMVTNATYNRIIKEIAMQLNIDKKLTTHTARKTFATLRNEEGWSTKSISDMLGNSMRTCENHYINNSYKRVENEMVRLNIVH